MVSTTSHVSPGSQPHCGLTPQTLAGADFWHSSVGGAASSSGVDSAGGGVSPVGGLTGSFGSSDTPVDGAGVLSEPHATREAATTLATSAVPPRGRSLSSMYERFIGRREYQPRTRTDARDL